MKKSPEIEAQLRAQGEPVAYMWQHEETGRIGVVDKWQLENGFEKANPRLKVITPLYATPQAPTPAQGAEAVIEQCAKLCEEIARRKGERFFGQLVSAGSAEQCARAIRALKGDDFAALEAEHFGDPMRQTGIYATPQAAQEPIAYRDENTGRMVLVDMPPTEEELLAARAALKGPQS